VRLGSTWNAGVGARASAAFHVEQGCRTRGGPVRASILGPGRHKSPALPLDASASRPTACRCSRTVPRGTSIHPGTRHAPLPCRSCARIHRLRGDPLTIGPAAVIRARAPQPTHTVRQPGGCWPPGDLPPPELGTVQRPPEPPVPRRTPPMRPCGTLDPAAGPVSSSSPGRLVAPFRSARPPSSTESHHHGDERIAAPQASAGTVERSSTSHGSPWYPQRSPASVHSSPASSTGVVDGPLRSAEPRSRIRQARASNGRGPTAVVPPSPRSVEGPEGSTCGRGGCPSGTGRRPADETAGTTDAPAGGAACVEASSDRRPVAATGGPDTRPVRRVR
jgi:hypothetical protein